jgi:hypothetical protein
MTVILTTYLGHGTLVPCASEFIARFLVSDNWLVVVSVCVCQLRFLLPSGGGVMS